MQKKTSRTLCMILSLVLMLGMIGLPMALANEPDVAQASQKALGFLEKNLPVEQESTDLDNDLDWAAFATARSGLRGYNNYPAYLQRMLPVQAEKLSLNDCARLTLAAMATTGSAQVGDLNLQKNVAGYDYKTETMTGAVAYALIALNAQDDIASGAKDTLKQILLAAQREDGGFNYLLSADPANEYSISGDVDSTAMVLNALAPYQADSSVKKVTQTALQFLQDKQLPSGGFGDWGQSADSTAQVIIALCSLGMDPIAKPYQQAEGNMLDALLSMQNTDGGMRGWDGASNIMSTYQSLCAFAAYDRFTQGKNSLFDCRTESVPVEQTTQGTTGVVAQENPTAVVSNTTATAQTQDGTDDSIPETGTSQYPAIFFFLLCAAGLCATLSLRKKEDSAA